jgi:signal transduction histidine kinase
MLPTRIEFATDWILSRIEASDAQRQQVKAIVQATVQDLMPLRAQHRQNRQALLQALAQPTIDRATLGDIRHAELQLADTASEQIVTAEQEERRRLALFLHDGPVQSMSGLALMLDAVSESVAPEALAAEPVATPRRVVVVAMAASRCVAHPGSG